MKLKTIISLYAVVLFGVSTAIYAGNVSDVDKAEQTSDNMSRDNGDFTQDDETVMVADAKSLIPPDSEGEKESEILKNMILRDFDFNSEARIVTKVNKDGTFLTEDLGTWIKKQDIFEISVVEDCGDYKRLFYELIPENADKEEYYYEEGVRESLLFPLVGCDTCITRTEDWEEVVSFVFPDGSFYTDYTFLEPWEEW